MNYLNKILLGIPFFYFAKTRLKKLPHIVFHIYYEFILGFLLLWISGYTPLQAARNFIIGYLGFISIYEIGYILNDYLSTRFEKTPSKRLENIKPGLSFIIFLVIARMLVFAWVVWYFQLYTQESIWYFYSALIIIFTLHNIIKTPEYRIITFISLAFLRFFGPIFIYISSSFLLQITPAIFIFYVVFRLLGYMDSKELLLFNTRRGTRFKLAYYVFFIPLSVFLSVVFDAWINLYLNIYFILFWFLVILIEKKYNQLKIV